VATEVIMPALGLAQETGKVLRWLKADGDSVAKGEALLEIETDKVTVEVEAPADGTLGGLRAAEGDDVPVGEPVAFVLDPGESAPEAAPAAAAANAGDPSGHVGSSVPEKPPSPAAPDTSAAPEARPRRRLASPKARRLAGERGIDLDSVAGSGPHGSVVAADLASAGGGNGTAAVETGPVWQRMAERVAKSWQTVPHFFLVREVDASRLNAWRDVARGRSGGEGVTHTDLLVRICAAALREHPRVNATWRDGAVASQEEINVGIAVATDEALVVPVVQRADELGLVEIAAKRAELVEAAREGRLAPADVQGGTFTISNLGMYGVDAFLAVVNTPQAAILAIGRIADRIVAVDGAPTVRPTLTLSLSFDHRVVDGARGARFLDTVATLVEEPAGLVDR
jgi:pyruvate dehydrogenase E2 component (dihydrolipoamide acetyltransferase)